MTSILLDASPSPENPLQEPKQAEQQTEENSLLFEFPSGIIQANKARDVPAALEAIEQALSAGHWLAGFCSYELGYALEPRLHDLMPGQLKLPLIWFGIFKKPRRLSARQIHAHLHQGAALLFTTPPNALDTTTDLPFTDYKAKFQQIKNHIATGDIYQLNLTFKARLTWPEAAQSLYQHLRNRQKVRYGGFLQTDSFSILSHSPELFFATDGHTITTSPMKGTARRGKTPLEDDQFKMNLQQDLKNRAENLMITDLMRNDLSRICQPGTVRVPKLFEIESFKTLHQMISRVEGKLRDDVGMSDILRALFPAGSIIGAPKIRAQEIIRQLEPEPRGIYTGAIGYMAPGRIARFNVAIRTLFLDRHGQGHMGIGSGIVQDSQAEEEYQECLLKMNFLNMT